MKQDEKDLLKELADLDADLDNLLDTTTEDNNNQITIKDQNLKLLSQIINSSKKLRSDDKNPIIIDFDIKKILNNLDNSIYQSIKTAVNETASQEMKNLLQMLSNLLKARENNLIKQLQIIKNKLEAEIETLIYDPEYNKIKKDLTNKEQKVEILNQEIAQLKQQLNQDPNNEDLKQQLKNKETMQQKILAMIQSLKTKIANMTKNTQEQLAEKNQIIAQLENKLKEAVTITKPLSTILVNCDLGTFKVSPFINEITSEDIKLAIKNKNPEIDITNLIIDNITDNNATVSYQNE